MLNAKPLGRGVNLNLSTLGRVDDAKANIRLATSVSEADDVVLYLYRAVEVWCWLSLWPPTAHCGNTGKATYFCTLGYCISKMALVDSV